MISFRIQIEPDDNGTLLVTSDDLPIVTYGADHESALSNAVDAAEAMIASMMSRGEDIPMAPGKSGNATILMPLQTTLKVELYTALKAAGLRRADLVRKLGWNRESVDRLFRLNHNSRIEQIDQAFAAIGKTVDVAIKEAA